MWGSQATVRGPALKAVWSQDLCRHKAPVLKAIKVSGVRTVSGPALKAVWIQVMCRHKACAQGFQGIACADSQGPCAESCVHSSPVQTEGRCAEGYQGMRLADRRHASSPITQIQAMCSSPCACVAPHSLQCIDLCGNGRSGVDLGTSRDRVNRTGGTSPVEVVIVSGLSLAVGMCIEYAGWLAMERIIGDSMTVAQISPPGGSKSRGISTEVSVLQERTWQRLLMKDQVVSSRR